MKKIYTFLVVLLLSFCSWGQTTVAPVVLQGFWWDYWNNNYPNSWANYLAELAPRLKEMGIDAIWVPPFSKGAFATTDVGYGIFDHYDLGDKFQKNTVATRVGTKDELLRMIAVMHANGIQVIQDVVLNHVQGAGSEVGGAGGQDTEPTYSMQTNSGYKNFRYVCYETPATDFSTADYWNRKGRWLKNYPNFHPHFGHNCTTGDYCAPYFGPDICYGDDGGGNGWGTSSNVVGHNPPQYNHYMRTEARNWIKWCKKQTGVDGYRWDAVKHFSRPLVQDLTYNLKYVNDWASEGEAMFTVGEYVGSKSELDTWVNDVRYANSGSDFLAGTFDFSLRAALYGAVTGSGFYNMANIPGEQQNERVAYYAGPNLYVHRTVPFVNNHDTFRPQLNSGGNYIGWNVGDELAPHIDPFEQRLPLAYAVALAVDGSPQIFFEDLFDIGGTGKRWTHLPTNTTDLPARPAIVNIIKCRQVLNFKAGAYKVRSTAAGGNPFWVALNNNDVLIIERSAKAVILANDNGNTWGKVWIDTDFNPGTVLKDYSGALSWTTTVQNDKRCYFEVPPSSVNGGYSIWGPDGLDLNSYSPTRTSVTTQEWEMDNDLGDSHCNSLGQGGQLPTNSTDWRLVGRIFVKGGQTVTYDVFLTTTSAPVEIQFTDRNFNVFTSKDNDTNDDLVGEGNINGTYTPSSDGWLNMRIRNQSATVAGQKCLVKVSYTAPTVVDTNAPANSPNFTTTEWRPSNTSSSVTLCSNWLSGKPLTSSTTTLSAIIVKPDPSKASPVITSEIACNHLYLEKDAFLEIASGGELNIHGDLYIDEGATLKIDGELVLYGDVEVKGDIIVNGAVTAGSSTVYFIGNHNSKVQGTNPLSLNNLVMNRNADLELETDLEISGNLTLTNGKILVDTGKLVTFKASSSTTGANVNSYIVGEVKKIGTTNFTFPIGSSTRFAPIGISSLTGTDAQNHYVAEYFFTGAGNYSSKDATLDNVSMLEYWWLQNVASPSHTPIITLHYYNASQSDINPSFLSELRVAHWTGTIWEDLGSSAFGGDAASGYVTAQDKPTSLSPITFASINAGNNPLPVVLTAFSGKRLDAHHVLLEWQTAAEWNNKGFEVQRSYDGLGFENVGFVAGNGTRSTSQRYSFQVKESKSAYYRLKQLNRDDSFELSAVIFVSGEMGEENFAIYPNPAKGNVKMVIPTYQNNQRLRLSVFNHLGMQILEAQGTLEEVTNKLNVSLAEWQPNLYVVQLETSEKVYRQKLIKGR